MSVKRGVFVLSAGSRRAQEARLGCELGLASPLAVPSNRSLGSVGRIGGPQTWRMGWAKRAHAVRHRS